MGKTIQKQEYNQGGGIDRGSTKNKSNMGKKHTGKTFQTHEEKNKHLKYVKKKTQGTNRKTNKRHW